MQLVLDVMTRTRISSKFNKEQEDMEKIQKTIRINYTEPVSIGVIKSVDRHVLTEWTVHKELGKLAINEHRISKWFCDSFERTSV